MKRKQATLTVTVNLDPVPGTFDNGKDFEKHIQRLLDDALSHYDPIVILDYISPS